MNSDIRLATTFFDHPKTIKLERQLGHQGVISLLRLWLWSSQNRPNGALSGMDEDDVEIAAHWSGEQGSFIATVTALRFVDFVDGVYQLHGWREHNEWQAAAENRSDASRLSRMAKTAPEAYKLLVDAGIKGVSRETYDLITASNDRLTVVQRLLTTAQSPFLSSPIPSLPEKRESSLRSDSSCPSASAPDVQNNFHPEIFQGALPAGKKAKPKQEFAEDSEPYRLAVFMRDTLKANVPTLKEPALQKWAQEFDVALRNDDRMKDARFVAQVIRWACSDGFWRANIQSPGKLREKFDQLAAKMEMESAKARTIAQQTSWKSPAQRRFEANQEAGQEAKRMLFGEQAQEGIYAAR